MSDSPIWWKKLFKPGFVGGCPAYIVYAQNRWDPVGTSIRKDPDVNAEKIGGFSPNEAISVDGWVHTKVAYPTNRTPWDSDIWFHLSTQTGWVSFAGVRGTPTTHDPSGLDPNGGQEPLALSPCEGKIR